MDAKEPEIVYDATAGSEKDDEDKDNPFAHMSTCTGHLELEGSQLTIRMTWHLDHSIDKEDRKEFLKYRCYALREAFERIKGVTGIRVHADGKRWERHHELGKPTVNKSTWCCITMGYFWPCIYNPNWEELKAKFIEIFEPASMHGDVLCGEVDTDLYIAGEFKLPEKGQTDA